MNAINCNGETRFSTGRQPEAKPLTVGKMVGGDAQDDTIVIKVPHEFFTSGKCVMNVEVGVVDGAALPQVQPVVTVEQIHQIIRDDVCGMCPYGNKPTSQPCKDNSDRCHAAYRRQAEAIIDFLAAQPDQEKGL